MSPREYAYWSVKWALDQSADCVKRFVESPVTTDEGRALIAAIHADDFVARASFCSYGIAAYWVHATDILRVPNDVHDEMLSGYGDGIRALKESEKTSKYVATLALVHLAPAMVEDLSGRIEAFDTGRATRLLLGQILRAYCPGKELSPADTAIFEVGIRNEGHALWLALESSLNVRYNS